MWRNGCGSSGEQPKKPVVINPLLPKRYRSAIPCRIVGAKSGTIAIRRKKTLPQSGFSSPAIILSNDLSTCSLLQSLPPIFILLEQSATMGYTFCHELLLS
jgi:hypothetical protein